MFARIPYRLSLALMAGLSAAPAVLADNPPKADLLDEAVAREDYEQAARLRESRPRSGWV